MQQMKVGGLQSMPTPTKTCDPTCTKAKRAGGVAQVVEYLIEVGGPEFKLQCSQKQSLNIECNIYAISFNHETLSNGKFNLF
jgi:hypothetical protein